MSWKEIIKDVRWNVTKLERFKRLLMKYYDDTTPDDLINFLSEGKIRTMDGLDALDEDELFNFITNEYYTTDGDDDETIRYKEELDKLAGEFRH